jgi:hypothetical protein
MRTPWKYLSVARDQYRQIRNQTAQSHSWARISLALTRGCASAAARRIDPLNPTTWEFSGFSQNGEDGIIEYLLSQLKTRNRYFVEIGASNGFENNSSWLAMTKRYSGLMVEGNAALSRHCREVFTSLNWGLQIECIRVIRENCEELSRLFLYKNPDVFSLDIDGIDYYVISTLLELGMRPKIAVVEYNSAFGPEAAVTVDYNAAFDIDLEHPTRICFGASIQALRRLFQSYGYDFVTVEQNGVNAFFVDPEEIAPEALAGVSGLNFAENYAQLNRFRTPWSGQFEMIKECAFRSV